MQRDFLISAIPDTSNNSNDPSNSLLYIAFLAFLSAFFRGTIHLK